MRIQNFEVKKLEIITNDGIIVDIEEYYSSMEIYESVFNTFVNGFIVLTDLNSLIEDLNIIGDETLHVVWNTFTLSGSNKYESTDDMTFDISSIESVNVKNDYSKTYTIRFISQSYLKDKQVRIRKSYTASPEIIAGDISSTHLGVELVKLTECKFDEHIVFPNMCPTDSIDLLTTFSTSEEFGSNFLFFETKDGFNYVTLDWLLSQKTIREYNDNTIIKFVDILEEFHVNRFQQKMMFDITDNADTGMFGSTLITHDIVNKTITEKTYNYQTSYSDNKHLGNSPLTTKHATGYEKALLKVISNNEAHSNRENWVVENQVRSNEFASNVVLFSLNSDPDLVAGSTFEFSTRKRGKTDGSTDKKESGKYLVLNIRKIFQPDNSLNMIIETVRESHNV